MNNGLSFGLPARLPLVTFAFVSALLLAAVLSILLVLWPLTAHANTSQPRTLQFEVSLDDTVIGEHRYEIQRGDGGDDTVRVTSSASFTVKIAFVPVYRYRHTAQERWRGDCLQSLQAETLDNGAASKVSATLDTSGDARADAGADKASLQVDSGAKRQRLPGCVMSFAYWNPAMLRQARLLNAQTGAYDPVKVERLPAASIDARGRTQPAERYRLEGTKQPIDLWYAADGQWLALETTVDGGRRLRYRLQ